MFFSHVKELYCTVERAYQDGLVCQYLDNVFENLTADLNMTTCVYIIGNDFIDFPSWKERCISQTFFYATIALVCWFSFFFPPFFRLAQNQ